MKAQWYLWQPRENSHSNMEEMSGAKADSGGTHCFCKIYEV